jgi:choline dehydrogenase
LLTTKSKVTNPALLAWLQAGEQAGYPRTDDHNGADHEGFGIVDCTVRNGKRISTAVAYLKPARHRPNLTVVTHAFATKVLMERDRAVGVEYQHGKSNPETKRAYAQAEVILSAGAFISPQLLMLSGIGDADHLRSVGVRPAIPLKGVGKNLHDHANVMLRQACPLPVTDYRLYTSTLGKAKIGLQYLFGRKGPAADSNVTVCAYLRSGAGGYDGPDLKFYVLPMMTDAASKGIMKEDGVSTLIILTRPESRGELTLRSADPRAMPLINANYMSAPRDREVMRRGIRIARDVLSQPAYTPYRGREVIPGSQCDSDADLDSFVRRNVGSNLEASGTCKMGSDELAVVDDRLRVHGVQGLRVVDTSIMPRMVTADTNGPAIMIAEKAADLILDP